VTTGVLVVAALVQPSPVAAEGTVAVGGDVIDDTPVAKAGISVTGHVSQKKSEAVRCEHTPLPVGENVWEPDGTVWTVTKDNSWQVKTCFAPTGQEISYALIPVGPRRNVTRLAAQAMRQLPLTAPQVATSPPVGRDQLVNLPTWLWLTNGWQVRSATASLPGVSVTVTAQPQRVVWEMGNGDQVVCPGPGRRYEPRRSAAVQSTDCSYTYRRSSARQPDQRYRVSATTVWRVTWSATGAAGGGDLGEVSRSTSFGLRVAEGQTLVTAARDGIRERVQ
jgi:hypothetical protein